VKIFESLKRLLEPRPRPQVETIGTPTADRPPPPEPEPLPEPASAVVIPPVEHAVEDLVDDTVEDTVEDTSDVSEVRALLEAVAEPVPSEPVAETPSPTHSPEPTLFEEPTQKVVDVPGAAPQQVGDALVLTLVTPPATFTVAKAAATIGRGQENTIRLDDLSVSRRHARIAYKQGGYWLSDTGSMGGTWVDGTRLNAPYRIGPGQIIDIGLCRLTVGFAGAASADKKETARKPRTEVAAQVRRRR
jgi:hypothetical protein